MFADLSASKHLPEIKFRLDPMEFSVAVSTAALLEFVDPDSGVRSRGFADEDPRGLLNTTFTPSNPPPKVVASQEAEEFDKGAQGHAAFDATRKVEKAAKVHFANVRAFLGHIFREQAVDAELNFPGFSLKKYAGPDYEGIRDLVNRVAEGYASVAAKSSRLISDMPPEKKSVAMEFIRRTILGLPM